MTGQPPTSVADLPVTVAITRTADPAQQHEMMAWMRAGTTMAESFPGFLGAGWVQPGHGSNEWHMLYRFSGPQTLADWEASPQRQWWLRSGQGLVEHTRTERRTGIEGWFEPPTGRIDVEQVQPTAPTAPPRWKQSVVIWLGFFPMNLFATLTIGRVLGHAPVVLRVLAMTLVLTPLMTYFVLPLVTARLSGWLHRSGSAGVGGGVQRA
jgi:antibiotic biosynthesis monooxygenase (ABM) superfamily enzyme